MLESINSPADLKNLSKAQLKDLCGEIRKYIIDCCAVNPGHLGSSLGAVELIVGLHYVFDTPHDKIVYDVGHQAYAHKILTGRREAFKKNRMKDGLSGFPKSTRAYMMLSVPDIHLHPFLPLWVCLMRPNCKVSGRRSLPSSVMAP